MRSEDHQHRQRGSDDAALPDVEQSERGFILYRGGLVFAQTLVVTAGLELLIAEVLHRLIVEQAVHGAGIGTRIQFVGTTPDIDAPLSHRDGEPDVQAHRDQGHQRKPPVKVGEQHRRHQQEFKNHRDDREQHVGEQRRDAARAALDVARHAAGLPVQMDTQRQGMQVAKHAKGNAPDRPLGHAHEHHVAQFGTQGRGEAQHAIGDQQHHRHHHQGLCCLGQLRGERIHHPLEHQRHADIGELGHDQQSECDRHATAKFQQIGDNQPYCAPFTARCAAGRPGGACG